MPPELVEEELTYSIIGAAHEAYNTLGFGFLEHIYVMALERELRARGHRVGREVAVPVMYKGDALATQRMDMIVDEKVIVGGVGHFRIICSNSTDQHLQNQVAAGHSVQRKTR